MVVLPTPPLPLIAIFIYFILLYQLTLLQVYDLCLLSLLQ
jgi:hypothetical protein